MSAEDISLAEQRDELSDREIRILRCVQIMQTADDAFPRDMPRLERLGLVCLSPHAAAQGPAAGRRIRHLTDAGTAIVEAVYHG